MARIAGINISDHKHLVISIQDIFGIGPAIAKKICQETGLDPTRKVKDLSDQELDTIRACMSNYLVEGDLKRQVSQSIKKLIEIGCYRGRRHIQRLPVRGQRTKTNARTRKGPRRLIKNKK